jgi:hypothetical protein
MNYIKEVELMATPNVDQETKGEMENETSIKGTMISVGLVGTVILITYFVVFGLYMTRV